MRSILETLEVFDKLKKKPRYGWVLCGVKNPESVAQHSFRLAIMVWLLGRDAVPKLNVERAVKIALAHELPKIKESDISSDWNILPNDGQNCMKVLKKLAGSTVADKSKREAVQLAKEKKIMQELLLELKPGLRRDVYSCWLEYKLMNTREGRFVRQADKVETLLQAMEYWGSKGASPVVGWWERTDTMVDDPVLLEFIKNIGRFFYDGLPAAPQLAFLIEIGKLKSKPCREFVSRGAVGSETLAEHAYSVALATWLLGFKRPFNLDKAIKSALVYEMCNLYACKAVVRCEQCVKGGCNGVFHKPRFLKSEKEQIFAREYKKELQALKKLTLGLPSEFGGELFKFWDQCKRQTSFAGSFVNQVFWLTTYTEALRLRKKDGIFPVSKLYDQMRQYIYDPELVGFLEAVEKKFLRGAKITQK
jgi:putative hydrolase of HD superfamily